MICVYIRATTYIGTQAGTQIPKPTMIRRSDGSVLCSLIRDSSEFITWPEDVLPLEPFFSHNEIASIHGPKETK